MITINDRWSFDIDRNKNYMPCLNKKVEPKDKEAYYKLIHTGTYHKDATEVLRYVIEYDIMDKFFGEEASMQEFLDKSKEITVNLMKDFKDNVKQEA